MHFFFYGLSVFLYSVAVFLAGMYIGEKLERAWHHRQERQGGI
jgi:putative Mn2+ efflux pump MntP